MTTRQQDYWAEWLANRHGRCRVEPLPDGCVILTGMTDDVDREGMHVSPTGAVSHVTVHHRLEAERYARRFERVECWRCGYPNRATLTACARCGSPAEAPERAA